MQIKMCMNMVISHYYSVNLSNIWLLWSCCSMWGM